MTSPKAFRVQAPVTLDGSNLLWAETREPVRVSELHAGAVYTLQEDETGVALLEWLRDE